VQNLAFGGPNVAVAVRDDWTFSCAATLLYVKVQRHKAITVAR
jgi:hypothetical protein